MVLGGDCKGVVPGGNINLTFVFLYAIYLMQDEDKIFIAKNLNNKHF